MSTTNSRFHISRSRIGIAAGTLAVAMFLSACNESTTKPSEPEAAPVISVQPVSVLVGQGDSASFSITATGAVSYQWIQGASDTLAGKTTATLTLTALETSLSGTTYKCLAIGADSSTISSAATLTVYDSTYMSRSAMLSVGDSVFNNNCTGCHGLEGHGVAGSTPPLANSDFFMADKRRVAEIVLTGLDDSVFVNGVPYTNGGMPPWGSYLDNQGVASILTYIRAVLNDSTVTSCEPYDVNDPETQDASGFAICVKTARTPTEIANDSVSVLEVKAVRDSLAALPSI